MSNALKHLTRLVHFFLFDLIWFLAVWGREQWLWLTIGLVVVLYLSAWRYLWARRRTLALYIVLGLAAEYLVVQAGIISFTGTDHLPWWLVVLWFGFAAMAMVVFTWLRERYVLAAIAGLVFGPVTYFAGVGLGAAQLEVDAFWVGVTYSLVWALLMMVLVYLLARDTDKEQRYV
ncbi:hypothetical protein CWE12_01425 [Aliidiomarina sedimenti]|uniref:DUF2878 domain-containing protein n=1 Tax=Aliidiomarina sedimenti TaxID=1933879 RepID=A0ABY0C1R9_9GAMM|nr:hypothetical protein CWE12_01425 [Aliidiomarina sedimenti]